MSKEQTSIKDQASTISNNIENSDTIKKNSLDINSQSFIAKGNNTQQADIIRVEIDTSNISKQLSAIEIEKYKPTIDDILQYAQAKRSNEKIANSSLNDYLKQKYFSSNQYTVVVADLSSMKIDNKAKGNLENGYLDLKGIDLTGSILKNIKFTDCDITGAIFCDTDLGNAAFENTKLKNVDFRGADLQNCQFDQRSYSEKKSYAGITGEDQKSFTGGIKYSMTSHLGRVYADIKADFVRKREKKAAIETKTTEVGQLYKKLSYLQVGKVLGGRKSGNTQYDKAASELSAMKEGKFPEKEYIMNKTFQYIFGSLAQEFDPTYVRGSDDAQRNQTKIHVSLSREDVQEYLTRATTDNNLSLNDFAKIKFKDQAKNSSKNIDADAKFVADFSGKFDDMKQEWIRPDLKGLEFRGNDLRGVNFSGADLSGCKFINADISSSTFESAIVTNSIFTNVTAKDVNFFNANLQGSQISGSNFLRAFMPKSNATQAKVDTTNFDHSDIRNGKWNGVNIGNSTFNYANLEGISLINASMQKVRMQHAILSDAMMNGATVIESEFRNSLMTGMSAIKTKWEQTSLEKISAKGINLTEADLDKFCKLDDAELQGAIMTRISAERVSFLRANMEDIKAEQANLQGSIITDAILRFAKLENAVLKEAQAKGVDMTGANLANTQAMSANFSQAMMKDINAVGINLSSADMNGTDLTGSDLFKATMTLTNLHRAKLPNANLKQVNARGANVEGMNMNIATNTIGANFKDAIGTPMQNGKPKSLADHQQEQEIINRIQNPSLLKRIGNTLHTVSNKASTTAEFIRRPIPGKVGRYVGLITGLTLGIAIAAAIPTGGLSLVAVAAVGIGVVAGCAAVGAITGHMAARRCGLTTALVCATGTGYLGPVVGLFGATFAAKYDIDGKAARFFESISNTTKAVAAKIGITKQSEEILKKHAAAEQAYVKIESSQPQVNEAQKKEENFKYSRQNGIIRSKANDSKTVVTTELITNKVKNIVQEIKKILKKNVDSVQPQDKNKKTSIPSKKNSRIISQ
ncbi:MAG: hypothetical protein EOP33_00475 [Rickettsiaceae bacterium]|nr:MAG: hypothetical protein EOP33_00475 [Rickettsiaceae bacterium]